MDNLRKLLEMLEDKLAYTRRLIAEYDETMDYVSHSSLMGFAEGIEFVMEEIEEALEGKAQWTSQGALPPLSRSRVRGQAKSKGGVGKNRKAKGTEGKGKNKKAGKSGTEGAGKGKNKDKAKGKERGKGGGRA
jgi:hypothetical protein